MKKGKREQEGIMHVYFRANGRYTVFYDDEDNIELLRRMDKFAKKYESTVFEFALMGNHAHFLVYTTCVSVLMRDTLKSYSRWYNKKYKNSNKVFKTPFSSACKRSDEWVFDTSMYILRNATVARICSKAEHHRWCSMSFHFRDEKRHLPIGYNQYLRLSEAIEIDTSFIDSKFKNFKEFADYVNNIPILRSSVIPDDAKWESNTPGTIAAEASRLLNGRSLNSLKRDEIADLIVNLYRNTGAKMLQIASVLHVDYKFVKHCIAREKNASNNRTAPQPE